MQIEVRVSRGRVEILSRSSQLSSEYHMFFHLCMKTWERGEGRGGRTRRTTTWVSGHGEVACRVHAGLALHGVLERPDGLATCDERSDLCGCGVALGQVAADVALDAAGVVAIAV